MNFLICSKLSIPAKDLTLPAWKYMRAMGHTFTVEHPRDCREKPDAIISMGVTIMDETFAALDKFPNTPLYCYNWDCYEWVWTRPRKGEYNYRRYGELLKLAREIWVPSVCTGKRTTQWWGLTNWSVILSACPYWEYENVRDDGYVLCTLRKIPDPWCDKFEQACESLGITYRRTDHKLDRKGYEDAVAGCRFLVNHYFEASTGGLTLMEGYYLGKHCLVSDSEWNGARDYMQDRAVYFRHGDENDFKNKLLQMWKSPPKVDRQEAKQWIETNYSDQRMIDDMLRRIEATCER